MLKESKINPKNDLEMICISCPMGCRLSVDATDTNNILVSGNTCPRGVTYARDEIVSPKRMVTGSVKVAGGIIPMVSVKTNAPIAKGLIFESLKILNQVVLKAPVHLGDIVVKNIADSGVDFVATRTIAEGIHKKIT